MAAWLTGLFGGLWARIALIGAILLAVAGILLKVRESGRRAERLERLERDVEVKNAQLEAANRRPRDRSELARRMRDGEF
jgi:hypothetical protein